MADEDAHSYTDGLSASEVRETSLLATAGALTWSLRARMSAMGGVLPRSLPLSLLILLLLVAALLQPKRLHIPRLHHPSGTHQFRGR